MGEKTAVDAPRSNMYMVMPEELTLVTEEGHPLFDPRVHLPLRESLVLNIKAHGVKEPILVRKNGDILEVVDGRQRVKHAIEANKRFRAEGCEQIRVRVIIERGDDATMAGIMVLTNENRMDDNPVAKAEKARKLIYDYGKSEADVAVVFGCTKQTLKMYLSLLDLCPAVRNAVERSEISATAASKLSKLHHDEQKEMLETMRSQGGPMTAARAERVTKGESAPPARTMRSRKEIEKALEGTFNPETENADYCRGWESAMRWVLRLENN